MEPIEAYIGSPTGVLGARTRTENSYISGLPDSDGASGGFTAINDGAIENCCPTMTIDQSEDRYGAFTVYGNESLTDCVCDRQMVCIPETLSSEAPEQNLIGIWTNGVVGAEGRVPGD